VLGATVTWALRVGIAEESNLHLNHSQTKHASTWQRHPIQLQAFTAASANIQAELKSRDRCTVC